MRGGVSHWVLGLDGGGTKTTLALANSFGEIQGPFRATGINPFDQPQWQFVLAELLSTAGGAKEQVVHACFGMPGFGEVEEVSAAQESAIAAWAKSIPTTILNDVEVAYVGAFLDNPGILILAGTGSMVWGCDEQHVQVRVGGWGELIGDERSAYWVGMQALGQLTWILDGRLHDAVFLQALQEATHTRDGDELLRWCYSPKHLRSRVAQLTPVINRLAEASNATAHEILQEAAKHLWAQARAAKQRLSFTRPVSYSYAGGMFRSSIIRDLVKQHVKQERKWLEPALSPLGVALWQAAKEAGWEMTPAWMQKVTKRLKEVEN